MENLKKYINIKNNCLLHSNFTFDNLFNIIHNQGDHVFCEFINKFRTFKFSYNDMKNYCFNMASFLNNKIKDEKHSFVGIYMENSINWVASFWGLLMLGYKPVLLNCKLPLKITLEIVEQLNVKSIICSSSIFDDHAEYNIIKLESGLMPSKDILSLDKFEDITWGDEIALSTTATTQNHKICIYSGKDITYQALNTKDIVAKNPMIKGCYKGQLKLLCFLPFYHVFGLVANYLWFAIFGRTFVFLNNYSSDTILKTIKYHEVTHIFAVPLFWNTIVKEIKKSVSLLPEEKQRKFNKGLALSHKIQNLFPNLGIKIARKLFKEVTDQTLGNSIKFMISGGGSISAESLYILNGVGYPLFNGYGSTEAGITSVELSKKEKQRLTGSIGKPFKTINYKIENDELFIKGSSMCSYIISKDKTKQQINKDEWFKSNDLAAVDKNGHYHIHGRLDDVVVSSTGEKISPDIIEKELLLTTVNNFCITDYKDELSLIFEISPYANSYKIKKIYDEIKNSLIILNNKGFVISKVYFTTNSMVPPNAIKVSRKTLKSKIENGDVLLNPFDKLINMQQENTSIDDEIKNIVIEQFALVLDKKVEEIDCTKHFIFELGGTSLDYCTLLIKLKAEFDIDFNFEQESCSTVEDFCSFIAKKTKGVTQNEKV